jgi:hypothetical protein
MPLKKGAKGLRRQPRNRFHIRTRLPSRRKMQPQCLLRLQCDGHHKKALCARPRMRSRSRAASVQTLAATRKGERLDSCRCGTAVWPCRKGSAGPLAKHGSAGGSLRQMKCWDIPLVRTDCAMHCRKRGRKRGLCNVRVLDQDCLHRQPPLC